MRNQSYMSERYVKFRGYTVQEINRYACMIVQLRTERVSHLFEYMKEVTLSTELNSKINL